MKFRLFAIVLALSLVVWAQGNPSTSTPNATPKPEATKSCCHHGSGAKDAMACCHHGDTSAKDAQGCCGNGKDKDKAKCEKNGKSCCDSMQAKDGKGCCAGMDMKAGKSCCGGKDKDMQACMEKCQKSGGCAHGKCCCGAADEKVTHHVSRGSEAHV
jgi:hypothetical protein